MAHAWQLGHDPYLEERMFGLGIIGTIVLIIIVLWLLNVIG